MTGTQRKIRTKLFSTVQRASPNSPVAEVIGRIPNRLALAGGWIDQPFVSKLDPKPPGSMVVVSLEPTFRPMDRAGFAGGTRAIAETLWGKQLPKRDPENLVRELYEAENTGKTDPSGSQDMIGIVYPGISRLDYNYSVEGGVYPEQITSLSKTSVVRWLERVLHVVPIEPRPEGYSPLGVQRLEPKWVRRLGQSGFDCFEAINDRDLGRLGKSLNDCMVCWEQLLPQTVTHPALRVDLKALLRAYQKRFPGAMYSGCGGGYLFVVSAESVPGSFKVSIRTS